MGYPAELRRRVVDLVEGGRKLTEPVTFRDDFSGASQEVYAGDDAGQRKRIRPQLETELRCLARTWFRNLRHQGFFAKCARREVLA